ncbi:hypothetical protein NDU88_001692 [Pleurodeles waltl]|uniref:Uncharacterized protein n=1 Tax=Pleurodeles waltl TaxID=8319 RepID=A0AAV7VX60_PLEWA|nr:hypothetical protein NDU88_001692 [Pleurodeles waltl]
MHSLGRSRGLCQEGGAAGIRTLCSAFEERALVLPGRRLRVSAVALPAQAAFRWPSDGVRLRAAEPCPEALGAVGFLTLVATCKVGPSRQKEDVEPIPEVVECFI